MSAGNFPNKSDKPDRAKHQTAPAARGVVSDKARRAIAGILELSKGATLGVFRIRDLINEGRP